MKCLLVTPIYTASARTGGGQRTLNLVRALAKSGRVDVMLLSEPTQRTFEEAAATIASEMPEATRVFVGEGTPQFLMGPAGRAGRIERLRYVARRLRHWLRPRSDFYEASVSTRAAFVGILAEGGYDLVVSRYLRTAAASGALDQTAVPVVVDLDDLDDAVLASRAASATTPAMLKPLLRLHLRQTRVVMRELLARCRHVYVSSSDDFAVLSHGSASVLPNIPFRQAVGAGLSPGSDPIALFVGTYMHRANREGVRHFIAHCWPAIRRAVPSARIRIVGSGGWEADRAAMESQDGVDVVGTVDRIDAEYANASVCVSPIQEGAGTKIKVLEGLLFGRPVVVMAHSARGYETLIGSGIVSAADDAAFTARCIELLRDPAQGRRDAEIGQAIVERDYSQHAVDRVVRESLGRVLPSAPATAAVA